MIKAEIRNDGKVWIYFPEKDIKNICNKLNRNGIDIDITWINEFKILVNNIKQADLVDQILMKK